ncbi:MAG: glycosyl transferase family 2 [Isosphaera sp.]|nr:glycosyl transferase family 2 [Isosphaera sp.]
MLWRAGGPDEATGRPGRGAGERRPARDARRRPVPVPGPTGDGGACRLGTTAAGRRRHPRPPRPASAGPGGRGPGGGMNPRVSVVVPTYNCGRYVVEAVESVLAQTRPAAEVLVVDDGSTDDTPGRLARFAAPVRVIRKENGGVSTARNRGVEEATGDLVAFLDADDAWHPRKLEVQLAALAARPDLGLLGTGVYDWPGPHPDLPDAAPAVGDVRADDLIVRNCMVTSTVVARAEVLRAAGPFDPNLRGPEDHDLWIRVALRAKVGNLRANLTGYRAATPGSLSKNAAAMEDGMAAILGKLEAAGVFRGRPRLRRKAWGYFRYACGYLWFRAGHHRAAVDRLARSLAGYPLPYGRGDVRYAFGRVRLLAAAAVAGVRGKKPTAAV